MAKQQGLDLFKSALWKYRNILIDLTTTATTLLTTPLEMKCARTVGVMLDKLLKRFPDSERFRSSENMQGSS